MIYVAICPKCKETVSFLNNEDTKICKNCNEVIFNTNKTIEPKIKRVQKKRKK